MHLMNIFFLSTLLLCCEFAFAEEDQVKKAEIQQQASKPNRPDVAICEGSVSAFFVSDNMNIRGANASAVVRGVNEKQCVDFCGSNQDHKGRTVLCASVVYESESQECRMFRRASFPDGEMERKPEEGRRYFEKFCLPEEAPAQCAQRQFVRVDDYILKGYAQSTTTVPTMAECVAACMREQEFECKSAMYFYEEGECITNVENAITAPDDFQRPDDEDKVIFFHNGCVLPGAGTAGQPGEFELAQSQDPPIGSVSTTVPVVQDDVNAIKNDSAISNASSSTEAISETTALPSTTPAAVVETSSIRINSESIQQSTVSTPPDRADSIPSNVPEVVDSNGRSKMHEKNLEENDDDDDEEGGQKLEESSNGQIPVANEQQPDDSQNQTPKAVPIPPSATEEAPARLHPKQLAIDKPMDKKQQPKEEPLRQYGAKTIERASDGSFQEKVPSPANDAAAGIGTAASPSKSAPANRKGPESAKRLQLKLIKEDQQPRPNISSVSLAPHPSPVSSSASPQPSSTEHVPVDVPETAANSVSSNLAEHQQQIVVPEQSAEEQFEGTEGFFSRWGPWTPCHVPGERRVRRRKCLDLRRCKGALMQVDYCPRDIPPPVDEASAENGPEAQQSQAASVIGQQQSAAEVPPAAVANGVPTVLAAPEAPIPQQPVPIEVASSESGNQGGAQPPAIMPPSQHQQQQVQPIPAGAPAPRPVDESTIWSPWNGTCQHFASSQPCKDGQVIGFESRECIAKDPLACKGPFFRYCTLPC